MKVLQGAFKKAMRQSKRSRLLDQLLLHQHQDQDQNKLQQKVDRISNRVAEGI